MTWQSKKNNVCVPDRDQSSSFLCISSFFPFNVGIVHHFDTVNHLDTLETGHMRTPSTCSCPPASSVPGLRKAGWGPGNEATHPLDLWTGEWNVVCYYCQIAQTFLRRLNELKVTQLLHEVGHLLCEAGQLLYEVDQQIVTAIMGCGRLRH